jgi:hypothetical protein
MPRPPRRYEKVHALDACLIKSKDAVITNLDAHTLVSPRLDMMEMCTRQRFAAVNVEINTLREQITQLQNQLQYVTTGSGSVVITGAQLVVQ